MQNNSPWQEEKVHSDASTAPANHLKDEHKSAPAGLINN